MFWVRYSVCLLLFSTLYGPDFVTLCWDEETCFCKVSPKGAMNVLVSLYIRTPCRLVQHCKFLCYLQSSLSQLSWSPSCTLQFRVSMNRPETDRSLRALQSWEIWGAQGCLPADWSLLGFDSVSLGMLFLTFRRYSLSIETSGTTHRKTRLIAEVLNSYVAHCCASCSWYLPPAASGDTVVGLGRYLVGVGVRNVKIMFVVWFDVAEIISVVLELSGVFNL